MDTQKTQSHRPIPPNETATVIETLTGVLSVGDYVRVRNSAGDIYEFRVERMWRRPDGWRGWYKGAGWMLEGQSFGPVPADDAEKVVRTW